MTELIIRPWRQLIGRVKLYIKRWTKPATTGFIAGILSDATRSRLDLIAENALLRQQLIVLRRQVKRPQMTQATGFAWFYSRAAPGSGSRHCTLSNPTPCCVGIGLVLAENAHPFEDPLLPGRTAFSARTAHKEKAMTETTTEEQIQNWKADLASAMDNQQWQQALKLCSWLRYTLDQQGRTDPQSSANASAGKRGAD